MKVLGLQPGNASVTSGLFVGANGVFARGAGNPGSSSSINPDAQAFITAAGITNPTQINAINTLVNDLQAASLWTPMQAIYPVVGGSASSHKYNLKNPADTNGAYRLAFAGGITHASTGMLSNGSTGYANTFLAPSAMTNGSAHWSYYSRTNILSTTAVLGAQTGGAGPWALLRNSVLGASNILADYVSGISDRLDGAEADSLGLHTFSATGGVAGPFKAYKRGVQLGATKTQSGAFSSVTDTFYLMASNSGGVAGFFTTRECAFATFGTGLSDADAANLETIVTAFQTTLGRQV